MPKGYWIIHLTVTDSANFAKFLLAITDAFDGYDPKFLVRGGRFETPEGDIGERHLILQFDSYETAVACYNSPAYQSTLELSRAAADTSMVIVEGLACLPD